MASNKPKLPDTSFPRNPEIVTFRYRGPDRRGRYAADEAEQQLAGIVRYDAKGNPVWEIRVTTPRRRKDDDTFDLLECLDNESLSVADDEEE